MVILYKLTTRSRPANMLRAYNSVVNNHAHHFMFVVSIDSDDEVTKQSKELELMEKDNRVTVIEGVSKNKVQAINRDVPKSGWDILVNLSDDQVFIVKDFDAQIIKDFNGNLDQFIHYPDGHVNELLPTMSIMGREYYNRFGYIYHPDYASLWCDNEAMDVAIELGKYKYSNVQIFDHLHPAWGHGVADAQLIRTQNYYRQDSRTFNKRKLAGFPKLSIFGN